MVTVQAKAWYTSKLMWLGIIELVIGALELIADGLASGEGWAYTLAGVLTMIFRWYTTRPVASRADTMKIVKLILFLVLMPTLLLACDPATDDRPPEVPKDTVVVDGGNRVEDTLDPRAPLKRDDR